ncbi:hypothetical protein CEUSTIGMA_g4627.t1 [Chlamydomonas eustigma]|uniref:Methyltransferase small domain-containing protein n=1 Tax=Chlamydomonas eustigma TaxID=1157962 RepID=A0A250X284_9CHLO|nr:hypothetical protein CEUSTIGMA_g4627.t1 [Chlamydomonas eustigma]|eukprot:GAX77181.1 hypothetical protein CEUSTIGMA_g4627.t1 [Chlamydomonas eustigma]
MATEEGDRRFYTSWAWKREHLPDRLRFKRPYIHKLENGVSLKINQAMFKAEGFASTVWDSSIVVCKYLEKMGDTIVKGKRCLDLSAGCGLVAVVLCHLGASEVVATDLPGNLSLLRSNCSKQNGADRVQVLDHSWGKDVQALLPSFDLIVACDVMYISEAVSDLVLTLEASVAPLGQVLLAHGRNKGGEGTFFETVQGIFSVKEVTSAELHEVYQCSDVQVYSLAKAEQVLQTNTKRRRLTNDTA